MTNEARVENLFRYLKLLKDLNSDGFHVHKEIAQVINALKKELRLP